MTSYHVTLDGQGYILDLASYHKRLVDRGGKGELGELGPWQQDDWRRGVGYGLWEPGTYSAGVNVDPSAGDLRIGRSRTSVLAPGATHTDWWALIVYAGAIYAAAGDIDDIYSSSDGTSWAKVRDTTHVGHRGAALYNGWLHFGAADGGEIVKFDGSTWTDAWVTLTGTKVMSLAPWYVTGTTGYLYAGVNQSSGGAKLYRVDSAGAATEIATVQETEISALIAHAGNLWVAAVTESGSNIAGRLYRYDGVRLLEVANLADNAITSFVEYRSQLWAGSRTRGKLWTVTTSGLVERFTLPEVAGIGGVSSYGLAMRSLLAEDDRLYVPVVTGDGFGVYVGQPVGPAPGVRAPVTTAVTRPDPVRTPVRPVAASPDAAQGPTEAIPAMGWSTPSIGSAGQEPRGIASFQGQVYLSNKRGSGAAVVRLDGATVNTSAVFVSSSYDAGRPGLDKLALRATVEHSALAAGESIQLEYDLEDSNSWVSLGTSDTDGDRRKTFAFGASVTFRRIRFRATFAVTSQAATPKLTAIVLEYRPKPAAKAAWEFDVRLEGTSSVPLITLDGTAEPKTGAQLADALWATAAKDTALTYVDLDGESKTVEVVAVDERVSEQAQRSQPSAYHTRGRVQLQEL